MSDRSPGTERRARGEQAQAPWQVIASTLAGEISANVLPNPLPAERVLCDRYGASRATIRRALKSLEASGIVSSSWGRGWYIGDRRLSEPPNSLMSFTELAAERGLVASSKIVLLEEQTAEMDVASTLRIAPGAPVLVLRRLRLLDDIPTLLQESTLPLGRLPALSAVGAQEFATISLYRIIEERCAVTPMRADFTVEARPNEPELAELLATALDRPLLWTLQTTYDLKGQPIELGWSAYPHDRYRFRASLVRTPLIPIGTDEESFP